MRWPTLAFALAVALAVLLISALTHSAGSGKGPRGTPASAPPGPPTATTGRLAAGALPLGRADYPVPAGAYVVSPGGDDRTGEGSAAAPWRTLGHAVAVVPNGATVVLRGGIYHEQVVVSAKRLTIQSWPGEAVWLSGSAAIGGFKADGNVWRLDDWNPAFPRDYPPQVVDPSHPMAGQPDMVFVDGHALTQVASRAGLGPGSFWVDRPDHRLYLGSAPAGHVVEASTLAWAIFFKGGAGSVLRGVGVRRYANSVNQLGAVHSTAAGVIFENDFFVQNASAGLSILGPGNRVVHDTLMDNGQLGVGGRFADRLVLAASLIAGNNFKQFDPGQAAGGVKLTSSDDAVVSANLVEDNLGTGIWVDESSLGSDLVRNVVRFNTFNGIQYEISALGVIASNAVAGNAGHGIFVIESNDVEVWNNTVIGNGVSLAILEGARESADPSTPGHDPRRPVPDSEIPWDVHRITVRNNVFDAPSATSVILVDDTTRRHSAASMQVSLDYDAYWRPTAHRPDILAGWSDWPSRLDRFTDLARFRAAVGQERHGLSFSGSTDPVVVDGAAGLYGPPADAARRGQALDPRVAAALGVRPGTPVRLGVL